MNIPKLPANEPLRLSCLQSLDILDTSEEERFDRYTRLTKKLLDIPIVVVSLIDSHRQWFKSHQGLDATETPREISFCGHAILGDDMFVVNDATQDIRFADNPLVTGPPDIRFYAGVPLKYRDGINLGTLCVIDTKPRQLTTDEADILMDMAALVQRELVAVQLAISDDLTEISNSRGFKILAQKGLNICYRKNINSCLAFLDLNGFKAINDQHGHAEGDRALASFAQLLKNSFRDSDVLARIGGDEFAILLIDTSIIEAEKIINNFREVLGQRNALSKKKYTISFSSGLVPIDLTRHQSIDDLLSTADSVMYENKKKQTG